MQRRRGGAKGPGRENYFELPGYSTFWSIFWPRSYQHQSLKAYIPFRLEDKVIPQTGPVVGVIEIDQNISGDLAEIANFRLIILVTLVVIMGLLFLVLRQIVKKAGIILERRQEEQRRLEAQLHQSERLAALGEMTAGCPRGPQSPGDHQFHRRAPASTVGRYEPKNRLAQIIGGRVQPPQ